MLSEELKTIHATLGQVLGKLGPADAMLVRHCRRNLLAVAELAEEMENWLVPALDDAAPPESEQVVEGGAA